jgi:hypothetical protein
MTVSTYGAEFEKPFGKMYVFGSETIVIAEHYI